MTASVVGIKRSQASRAVCYQRDSQLPHVEGSNAPVGFAQVLQVCGAAGLFVRGATGRYSLALA